MGTVTVTVTVKDVAIKTRNEYFIYSGFSSPIMRLKLQAEPPFPPLKAWFPVPTNIHSINNLKSSLKSAFKVLTSFEFDLFLDDFELLDESVLDVLRDGDLVWYTCPSILPLFFLPVCIVSRRDPMLPRRRP